MLTDPVVKRRKPPGKPNAWKKLPQQLPEHEYTETEHRLRLLLRSEIKDQRMRSANCKWYANVTKNDAPGTLSHRGWIAQRREHVGNLIELRKRLRATNRGWS